MSNDKEEVRLFYPKTSRDLRIQYPELNNIPEFKKLNSKSMLFVWYWANPTSPVDHDAPYRKRIEECLKYSEWKPSNEVIRALYEDVWPEDVKEACSRMSKFETNLRNKSRKIYNEIFANFEKMVKVKESDFQLVDKEGNSLGIDFAARNQYVNYAKNIAAEIPNIIKKMEEGFGTEEVGEVGTGEKAIDIWHKSKQA